MPLQYRQLCWHLSVCVRPDFNPCCLLDTVIWFYCVNTEKLSTNQHLPMKKHREAQRDCSLNWQGIWWMGGEIETERDEITTLQGKSIEDVELEFKSLSCHHVHATLPSCELRPPLLNARLGQKAPNTKWCCLCCLDCKLDRGPWQPRLDCWSWFYCSAWPWSNLLLCYNSSLGPALVSVLYEHPYSQNQAALASHSDKPQDPIRYQFW